MLSLFCTVNGYAEVYRVYLPRGLPKLGFCPDPIKERGKFVFEHHGWSAPWVDNVIGGDGCDKYSEHQWVIKAVVEVEHSSHCEYGLSKFANIYRHLRHRECVHGSV